MFDTDAAPFDPQAWDGDLDSLPQSELEARAAELTTHINVAQAQLLKIVAVMSRKGYWDGRGPADYMSWRFSMSRRDAREMVDTAEKLEELPKTAERLADGKISYCMARSIARIGTPECEENLLQWADGATAAQMDTIGRFYRKVENARRLAESNERYTERFIHTFYDDYGTWNIQGRLSAEDGAVIDKAIDAVVDELMADRCRDGEPEVKWAYAKDEGLPSFGARRADALSVIAESVLARGLQEHPGSDKYQVVIHVDAESLAGVDGEHSEIEDGCQLSHEAVQRICCNSSLVTMLKSGDTTLDLGRKTRKPSKRLRRALKERDRHCLFPGCTALRFLDAHHQVHWPAGGKTDPENLSLLCRFHHRLVHEKGYVVERTPDGSVIFKRPDGSIVERVPAPPPVDHDLVEHNAALGHDIDRKTLPTVCIDDYDLSDAVYAVQEWNGRLDENVTGPETRAGPQTRAGPGP